jgi:arylsulfatase
MARRPNILLIFSDQHRGDTVGCTGHPVVKTPNLDRLAAEGATFTRCCTNSPLCMPARASFISGRYVNQHGVWNNKLVADRHGPSHVRNVRDAGYHTTVIGKTHLYTHPGAGDTRAHIHVLEDWGYQDIHELTGPRASANVGSEYTDYLAEKGLLETHRQYMSEYNKAMRDGRLKPWDELPCPLPAEDHLDSYTARTSADWVRNYNSDKPFYLQVCFPGPHDPFDSPAEYRALYRPEDMPVDIMEWPSKPIPPYVEFVLRWSALDGMTREQKQVMRTHYYGKVTLIDDGIGLILKALEERGMLDNTWIIYTSDHGEMLGDHYMCHKIVFYEGALRVPLITRPPGGIEGWKSNALTDHLDVAASLLDIAGAETLEGSDGHSLAKKCEGGPDTPGAREGKGTVFSEVYGHSMVLTERYKMAIDSSTHQPVELYDMTDDPDELRNLVEEPSLEKVRHELQEQHLDRLMSHFDKEKYAAFQKTM